MNILVVIILVLILLLLISGGFLVRNSEKKQWNNGTCVECGEEWRCFDMDSQGGRMYKCKNGHYCDISYNVDK
jgi:hypothetical protein